MKTELLYGLLLALAGFLWVCGEYAVGLHTTRIDLHPIVTNFFLIVLVGIFIIAIRAKRNRTLGGSMTWWQGVQCGLGISLVTALAGIAGQWIFFAQVNPGFFEAMIQHAVDSGKATTREAHAYFNLESHMLQGIVGTLVLGFLTAAIVSIFLRKPPSAPNPAIT